MRVTSSKTEKRTAYLTVEVEAPEVEEYMDKVYKRMVKRFDIPGFSKGNAPREALEKHVGRDSLLEQAIREMTPKVCSVAIKDKGLKTLTQPMAKVTKKDPLIFEIVVPLVPIVEIGDYRSIRMQPILVDITEKDVDNVLEKIRQQHATIEPADRPVKSGDFIAIDVVSTVYESPFINDKGVKVKVSPEFPPEIPGLTDHFIGMEKDEEKEFMHKLPEDYPNKQVAGKEALFKVKVLEVKEEKLPKLDDNLAKMIAPEIKTIGAFRDRIAKNMQIEYDQKAKNKFEEEIITAIIDKSNLEFSSLMIEAETELLFQEGLQQLQSSCKSNEEFEAKIKQIQTEQVKEQYKELAERRISWNLVLSEIAKAENIEVSNDEIEEQIEKLLQGIEGREKKKRRKQLNEERNIDSVIGIVSARKTFKLLVEIATSPDKPDKKEKRRGSRQG